MLNTWRSFKVKLYLLVRFRSAFSSLESIYDEIFQHDVTMVFNYFRKTLYHRFDMVLNTCHNNPDTVYGDFVNQIWIILKKRTSSKFTNFFFIIFPSVGHCIKWNFCFIFHFYDAKIWQVSNIFVRIRWVVHKKEKATTKLTCLLSHLFPMHPFSIP